MGIQAALLTEKSVVVGELESKNKDNEELAAALKSAEATWLAEKAAVMNDLEEKNKELVDVNDELKAVQAVVTEKNNVIADLHVEVMMKVGTHIHPLVFPPLTTYQSITDVIIID